MSETAAEKPAFRDALKRRRCLIPADGFFEWKKIAPKAKQAYNFGLATGSVFAFAGLWDQLARLEQQRARNLHDPDDHAEFPRRRGA